MPTLQSRLTHLFANKAVTYQKGLNNELIATTTENPRSLLVLLAGKDFTLVHLFCTETAQHGFILRYVLEQDNETSFLIIEVLLKDATSTSVADIFPSACWFERAVTDGFGITFEGAFDTRPLFLHEMYPKGFHPLRKTTVGSIQIKDEIQPEDEYPFKHVHGEGVYTIPVGPVHAGIIEPGHFHFSVIGETIFNLEIRMFYKHRGIEKLAEGKRPDQAVKIAESISGDESIANSVAFCTAVEKICQIQVPDRAHYLRTFLLELERIYSHLADLAGMNVDVAAPVYATPFFVLREELFRMNERLTGSRFLRGSIGIGGLQKDISDDLVRSLAAFLASFKPRFQSAVDASRNFPLIIDRMEKTGIVNKELVRPLALSGPTARASGVAIDTRVDHPYGLYGTEEEVSLRTMTSGDVLARFDVKTKEVHDSLDLIQRLAQRVPAGPVIATGSLADGQALSVVESARGQSLHWVSLQNGCVDRYSVRTASFCNWQAIEHAVLNCIVADFPLVNKSLNLSYAGTDL
jgi:formate hydrogenlyase subunit 5